VRSGSQRSRRSRLRHFYHVYAGGDYEDAVAGHGEAMRAAGLDVAPEVGIVGTPGAVEGAVARLAVHLPGFRVAATAEAGFEHVTLAVLHEAARRAAPGTPFFYAHTKGATSRGTRSVVWRREMTDVCVGQWRDCTRALAAVDAAGCRWIGERRIFAGNFWWARAGYLASLPPPYPGRQGAEDWIGTGQVRVADLLPGLPCTRQVRVRMLQHVSGGHLPPAGSVITVTEMEALDLCRAYPGRDPPALAEYA
jgi:hypothetical protein